MKPPPDQHDAPPDDDPHLLRAAQEYLVELETGRRPPRSEFLARFPDFASRLEPYLDALDMVHAAGPELRSGSGRRAVDVSLHAEPLGDFRIVREIGCGGMGIVYEAVQLSLGRSVALKVLPFVAALDPRQLRRFQNEAQAAAQLHHGHIVPVYAVGCERGVHYYAMQLIEGQNLADLIHSLCPPTARDGSASDAAALSPASPSRGAKEERARAVTAVAAELSTQCASRSARYYRTAAGIALQAAEALEHAHQLGVIHRDIKPANLLVDARGHVWITDFGLAQFHNRVALTRTGDLLGTLRYMSPEQAGGRSLPLDPRTDIYSLGATLYELLTLQPPFDGGDHAILLRQILDDEPRPPRALVSVIPAELETIVLKAISKNPAERYASAQEFADDLRRFLDNRPILARRPTLPQHVRKWAQRHPAVVIAAIMLLVLLTVGSLVSAALVRAAYQRERQRAEEAEARFQLARRAVDELIQLSQEELADKPFTESLRRRILESALVYYQEFIEQRCDDPVAQADLVATQEHVKKILADLALLQGAGQMHLLSQEAVLDDLGLDEEQQAKVAELSSRLEKRREDSFKGFHRLSPEARQKCFLDLARANDAEVRLVLSPDHLRRLQQIVLQLQGPGAFREPDVAAALKLTSEQRERIRAIEVERFFGGPPGRGRPGDPLEGMRPGRPPEGKHLGLQPGDRHPGLSPEGIHLGGPPEMPRPGGLSVEVRKAQEQKRRAAALERILAVLTPEQVQQWKDMIGRPFQGPITFRPPFGLFGPPR